MLILSFITVTVLDYNELFHRLFFQRHSNSLANAHGVILLAIFVILSGLYFLALGNQYASLLAGPTNVILTLASAV